MDQLEWEATVQRVNVVVGCLIQRDGKYLLVKEQPEGVVVYNLPAGHVDAGEQLEVAAIRETRKETGYEVRLLEEVALYHESAQKTVKHIYSAEIIGGAERPQEGEILEVVWLSFDEVMQLDRDGHLRRAWVGEVIRNYEAR